VAHALDLALAAISDRVLEGAEQRGLDRPIARVADREAEDGAWEAAVRHIGRDERVERIESDGHGQVGLVVYVGYGIAALVGERLHWGEPGLGLRLKHPNARLSTGLPGADGEEAAGNARLRMVVEDLPDP